MPPKKAPAVAIDEKLIAEMEAAGAWDYCPRRDVPATSSFLSNVSPDPNHDYIIVYREPGDHKDPMPKYLLQDLRLQDSGYIQVSLMDIELYVSPRELETYENARFANKDLDFSSKSAWLKEKKLKPFSTRLIPKARMVNVVIKTRLLLEQEGYESESHTPEGSPPKRMQLTESFVEPLPIQAKNVTDGENEGGEEETEGDAEEDIGEEMDIDYEVSHILEEKDVLGRSYYLVAWKGLPDDKATWLTIDELNELGFEEPNTNEINS
jgi:hypothetical protein